MISYFLSHFISCGISLLIAFLPFTMIFGSKFAWFSCASMVIPALGSQYSLVYVIFYIFTKSLYFFSSPKFFILKRLPLLCATWALRSPNYITSILVPFGAMILFVVHPVGCDAWIYSCYWLIPMIIYFKNPFDMIGRVVSASFIAHAVGSVVFLYSSVDLTSNFWIGLIPCVAAERITIAFGIYLSVRMFEFIQSYWTKKVIA